ncbi:zinc finger protein-like 1, partial [Ciconia boyciana]|uniref:zinc finger protein-like 1 n=1 Tax=Ciconia boyciana TaxID=52775 RepID=UPI003BA01672
MGLCKCPKRKVTNLFCFEHRVNVCESCLVSGHHKCIVQSYLQWLQDSDYSPDCPLCDSPLAARETVRLVCYDVFHWSCLAGRARALPPARPPPATAAPRAGPLFPQPGGPGRRRPARPPGLRPWARPGLGLPLIEDAEATPDPDPAAEAGAGSWDGFGAPVTPRAPLEPPRPTPSS